MASTNSLSKSIRYTREEAQDDRHWWVVDLKGKTLGRAATTIASVLRGKHKPRFTPNVDCGDFVIVLNADKINLTGKKMTDKMYHYHTQYPGGLVSTSAQDLLATFPERVIQSAVWGMLPKGSLGREMLKKLKVYAGDTHGHQAQQPKTLAV